MAGPSCCLLNMKNGATKPNRLERRILHRQISLPCVKARLLAFITLATFQTLSLAEVPSEEAKHNARQETLRTYIENNAIIVDTCVYEQSWIPPSEEFRKGRLVQRAAVTHVHTESLKVGDRIEYIRLIEEPPRFLNAFTSTVNGELRVFFYDPDGSEKTENGVLKVVHDGHWGFGRVGNAFAELFKLELQTNPKLKLKSK